MLFRQKNKDEEFERRIQELEERLTRESEARQGCRKRAFYDEPDPAHGLMDGIL